MTARTFRTRDGSAFHYDFDEGTLRIADREGREVTLTTRELGEFVGYYGHDLRREVEKHGPIENVE